MRIAWLMPNLHITGGARAAVELSNQMIERGHRVSILLPRGRLRLNLDCKAEVIECGPAVNNPLLAVIVALISMPGRIDPNIDLMIASMPPNVIMAHNVCTRRNIPMINYLMNDDVRFFDDKTYLKSRSLLTLYRYAARQSLRYKHIIANSHWTAVQCVGNGGLKPSYIVNPGFSPGVFYPDKVKNGANNPIRLVTVGRVTHWKGFPDLVEALNILSESRSDFILRIISQDEINISSCRFPAELVKPSNDFELAEHYRWGDIFIHSSWFEGFGLPPLEAQACGVALVSTDSGGVREYLKDRINSIIVSPREPHSLSAAIAELIDNPELRNNLVRNGLESCREFTWDNVSNKFEKSLLTILEAV